MALYSKLHPNFHVRNAPPKCRTHQLSTTFQTLPFYGMTPHSCFATHILTDTLCSHNPTFTCESSCNRIGCLHTVIKNYPSSSDTVLWGAGCLALRTLGQLSLPTQYCGHVTRGVWPNTQFLFTSHDKQYLHLGKLYHWSSHL